MSPKVPQRQVAPVKPYRNERDNAIAQVLTAALTDRIFPPKGTFARDDAPLYSSLRKPSIYDERGELSETTSIQTGTEDWTPTAQNFAVEDIIDYYFWSSDKANHCFDGRSCMWQNDTFRLLFSQLLPNLGGP